MALKDNLLILYSALFIGCQGMGDLFSLKSNYFEPAQPKLLEQRISETFEKKNNGKVDHFAVILSANPEARHHGNISMAYQILLEVGYNRDNIFILDPEGPSALYPFTDWHTLKSNKLLMETLSEVVEPIDTLVIYFTGHGHYVLDKEGNKKATSKINPGEHLSQTEFENNLSGIKPDFGLVLFDQCYWGQFGTNLRPNWSVISTATAETTSYLNSFPRNFLNSFRVFDENISIKEAFEYAKSIDVGTVKGSNSPELRSGVSADPSLRTLLGTYKKN